MMTRASPVPAPRQLATTAALTTEATSSAVVTRPPRREPLRCVRGVGAPARPNPPPAGLAVTPDGSLIARPIRRSPQSIANQRPRSAGIVPITSSFAHLHEELPVVLRTRHLLQQELDRLRFRHVRK